MIRRFLYISCLVSAVSFLALPAFCEHPDFSGSWRLDTAQSSFGAMTPADSGTLTISTGSHKMLHLAFSVKGSHNERTVESDWKVDDRFHPVSGDGSGEVLAKWEGSVLVGKKVSDSGMEEIRLRLDPGARTLTESIQTTRGLTTLVWRRD